MEDFKLSLEATIKLDLLNARTEAFEVFLDNQISELGAGKIANALRSAIEKYACNIILVSSEYLYRLLRFGFVNNEMNKTFDGISIVATNYVESNTFLLSNI